MQLSLGGAASRAACVLAMLSGCALPSIHREVASEESLPGDADVADVLPALDEDAGVFADPSQDPRNHNEDERAFRALLPKDHLWAEWPMPDSSAQSKFKPSYTVSGALIVDNVTKLRWQRVMPEVYPGCAAEYEFVGRKRGIGTGCTWDEARAYCARSDVAEQLGPGRWRLPTKIELESLIDVSRLNTVHPLFDAFPIDRVWSSTPILNPRGTKLAWAVDFTVGTNMDSARFKAGRVRCVSSPNEEGGRAPNYQLVDDIVRDHTTQLDWHRYPDSATRTFEQAALYCADLTSTGGGWRLPTLKELMTIVDPSRQDPAVFRPAFSMTQSERYWTASEYLLDKDIVFKVDFKVGGSLAAGTRSEMHFVRCVRSR